MSSSTRLRSGVTAVTLSGPGGRQSRSRTTTYRPTGRPRAANSSFMYSLSMPAALANTPAPAYRAPAISSRPWSVPSSPYAPCSSGSTTSTSPRLRGGSPGAVTTRPRVAGSRRAAISVPGAAMASTDGSSPPAMASCPGSSGARIQRPSRAMPTGTTS